MLFLHKILEEMKFPTQLLNPHSSIGHRSVGTYACQFFYNKYFVVSQMSKSHHLFDALLSQKKIANMVDPSIWVGASWSSKKACADALGDRCPSSVR